MADRLLLGDNTSFLLLGDGVSRLLLQRGTLYYVAYPSSESTPSKAQIKAGQNAVGGAATAAGSEPGIISTGTQTFGIDASGLTAGVEYTVAYLWSGGNPLTDSNVSTFTLSTTGGGGGQTLSPPLITVSVTLYGPTLTRGVVSLAPPLLSTTQTFYGPVVTRGAVSVALPLLTNAQTFYGPTLTRGAVTIEPPLLSTAQTFYDPVVARGPVSLAPPLLDASATAFAPVVSQGGIALVPPLLDASAALFAPTVVGAQRIEPPLLINTQTLYGPTLTRGVVSLAPPLLSTTQTFYGPVVSQGGITLAPPLLTNAQTFYGPTLTRGAVTIAPPLLDAPATPYAPTVTDGTPPPEPAAPTTGGVPGGRGPRIAVRIDGELYVGSYAEISELVASLGERDAFAEVDAPVPSARVARTKARKAAGKFDKSMQVVDIGMPVDLGIDPAPVAQRDLREDYLRAYAAALLVAQQHIESQSAREAQRREQEIEDDDTEVIEALLELL